MSRITCTLYLADRMQNELMASVDLCPDWKVFAEPVTTDITLKEGVTVGEEFFTNLILKSKHSEQPVWVAAIQHGGVLYKEKSLKIISDGKVERFV